MFFIFVLFRIKTLNIMDKDHPIVTYIIFEVKKLNSADSKERLL